jgi:two-component system, NarL family, sensor histidine kinase EvgS
MYSDVLKEETELKEQTLSESEMLPTSWLKLMHDMKSPLVGLEACIDAFQGGDLSERQHDVLSLMGQNLAFLRGLLNGHMEHQKASKLSERETVRHVSLRGCLKSWLFPYKKLCQQKGLDFHVVVDSSVENDVIASELNLGRIIHNILQNALKYTVSGSISCRFSGYRELGDRYSLEIIFEDSGVGIPSHQLPWVLQPFHQATALSQSSPKQEGVGLGLTIVNQLVEDMGGQMQIESESGQGTQISIKLPLTLACPRLVEAEQYFLNYPPSKPSYPNLSVLMVGFGEKDLNRLKPYFEYLGFQVVFAEHQSQLLEIAKRFDLVCLPEEALTLSNLSEYKALSGKCLVIQQQLFPLKRAY